MPAPLLSTKLKFPLRHSSLVSRPRLIEKLNAGLDGKLSLISAPAGYGKTTLLGDWAATCLRPMAWLSLDEGENQPGCFLQYLVAALQKVLPGLGAATLTMPEPWPAAHLEATLTSLLNEIAEASAAIILVLDDYHKISSQPVHDAVTFLLERLPPQLHVVISTRSDPPLPIARLRARGELAELRQNDLRFSVDETARFLEEFLQLQLSMEDVEALVSRTEGWITGLQLAALSLQNQPDASAFIAKFTGGQHHVLDYLVEEVLTRQPEQVQAFLLHTCILDRMSGSLCDEVTRNLRPTSSTESGQDRSGQEMLEHLEHGNLFVLPLDEDLHWYRYHQLFAACLRQLLDRAEPQLVAELHRRAAAWYQRNDDTAEAVHHWLAAGDREEAAQLVEQHGLHMLTRGEMLILSMWLDQLPDQLIRQRPWLCVLRAWVLVIQRYESVESWLQIAEQALELRQPSAPTTPATRETGDSQVRAHLSILRAIVAIATDDTGLVRHIVQRVVPQLPGESIERVIAAMMLGWATRLHGDLMSANRAYAEARQIALETGFTDGAVSAMCCLGDNRVLQGQLHKAEESYEEALHLAASQNKQDSPAAGYVLIRLGEVYREWNEPEAAVHHVMKGIHLCRLNVYSHDWAVGFVTLARIYLARGDLGAAQDALQSARQLTAIPMVDFVAQHLLRDCQVRVWLAGDDWAAAAAWRTAAESQGISRGNLVRELEYLTLARVLIAQGQIRPTGRELAHAVSLLTQLQSTADSKGCPAVTLQAMILKSLALQIQGHVEQAMAVLTEAVQLAEPEGYARIFIDEGAPMAKLLRRVGTTSHAPEYAHRLVAMFGEGAAPVDRAADMRESRSGLWSIESMQEPLSEREFAVLRLLPTDLSGPAIAGELCVSPNTARTHIRHLYGKLHVHSRYEAILRAKELGLI